MRLLSPARGRAAVLGLWKGGLLQWCWALRVRQWVSLQWHPALLRALRRLHPAWLGRLCILHALQWLPCLLRPL